MFLTKKNKIILSICLIGLLIYGAGSQWLATHYVVPIMMYHHVAETSRPKTDTVSPGIFVKHMEFLKRNGQAEEAAAVIVFLASDTASFLNGALVDINGGRVLR